jgi:hypothetical protein
MPAFRKTTVLVLCLYLSFDAKPILAESPQETHANPNLIHQGSYGPIQKNDTIWSIAKLLKNQNESINDVITELTLSNHKAIRHGSKLFVGQYIHRHSAPDQTQEIALNIRTTEQPHTTTSEPQDSTPPIDTNVDLAMTSPTQDTEETATTIIPYTLSAILSIFIGLYFGLAKINRQRLQQKITQDETDKINALKRELIKNRLKPTSTIELS